MKTMPYRKREKFVSASTLSSAHLMEQLIELNKKIDTLADIVHSNEHNGVDIHRPTEFSFKQEVILHLRELRYANDLLRYDMISTLSHLGEILPSPMYFVESEHPVAYDSDDHKFPRGAMHDNTRHLRFVHACEQLFAMPIAYCDLGCSGGGLVWDFLLRGHHAVGLEGSDFSKRAQRAEWRLLKEYLFTCDIAQPYLIRMRNGRDPALFDVITAWEVLEHINSNNMETALTMIHKHLHSTGLFIGSIGTSEAFDPATGAIYHQTVKPQEWWESIFLQYGLQMIKHDGFTFYDFCRGIGNGPLDWLEADFSRQNVGFHFCARKM